MRESNVVNFNSKRINKSAEWLVEYLKYVGAPLAFCNVILGAAKDHFEMNRADGEVTFQINSRMNRGVFEMRLSTNVFEGKEAEDDVLPLVFISSSLMHMGHYAAMAGLKPNELHDKEKTLEFMQEHLHGLMDAVGASAPNTGMNEAFAFASCILMSLAMGTHQIYAVEGVDGDRHYFGLTDNPESEDELEFISITFSPMGIAHDKARNLKIARSVIPTTAPMWDNDEDGTIKATLTMAKDSPLFKGQKLPVWEEIIGSDREAMEVHIRKSLQWLAHYDTHYNSDGWTYAVKWGTHKPKKKRE